MEESIIKKYLEQLENAEYEFLKDLTPEQQWELGTKASHWGEPLHFPGFDWNWETEKMHDLYRLFGAKIADYGWSVYDTYDHVISNNVPVIMGIMAGLGFEWVGLEEATWYDVDENLTSSMDEEERRQTLADTFLLKVRFYPNRPSSDKEPDYIWPNNMETVSQVLEKAEDRAWVTETRNQMWFSCYEVTPHSKKYDVLSKLEVIEPRMTMDRENIVFHGIKNWHELVLFRNSILLVKYKQDVMAFGPDAILMA